MGGRGGLTPHSPGPWLGAFGTVSFACRVKQNQRFLLTGGEPGSLEINSSSYHLELDWLCTYT